MAGVNGTRLNNATINNQTKQQDNGDGWRRGEEGSEGKGKSGATMELILLSLAALIFRAPNGIKPNRAWAASPMA